MDADLKAARDAERKAAELDHLGPRVGAGATIWARAIQDVLPLHESARERFATNDASLEVWERFHATGLTLIVAVAQVLAFAGRVESLTHDAEIVAELTQAGLRKQTIRKTVSVLAMVLDHHGVQPNPARDRRVKLPREEKRELTQPTAADVLAVHSLLPSVYRLPLLVLDATGMRVGEMETLTWGDVDERRGRWRLRSSETKTRAARWVSPPQSCSLPSSRSARATTAYPTGPSSEASALTASEPRSRAPAQRRASRRSRPTTCASAASRSCTRRDSPGRASASSSATPT